MLLDHKKFAEFLEERADAGDGYIMGAVGQDPKTLSPWYFNQYKDRNQYSAKQEQAAIAWKDTAERVWDCHGLADGYVSEKTGVKINVRARDNYAAWCGIKGEGDIPAERRVPGAAVFMRSSYIHHVGYLVRPVNPARPEGDWIVVEARGVTYGVVRTKLSQRDWTHWGWMTKYFDYAAPEGAEPEEDIEGRRMLRRGMTGGDVAALQADLMALGYDVGADGADGVFGRRTEAALIAFQLHNGLEQDGIAGPETYARMDSLLPESGDMPEAGEPTKNILIRHGQTWNVRTQPTTKSAVKGIARRGDLYSPGGGPETEGWVSILFNGESAWVSERAVS